MATERRPNGATGGWIVDSGATSHFCADRKAFTTYKNTSQSVRIGDDSSLEAIGCGTVDLMVYVSGVEETLKLRNVLHVPDIAINLLSAGRLAEYGKLVFSKSSCRLFSNSGQVLLEGLRQRQLYYVCQNDEARAMVVKSKRPEPPPVDLEIAHRRLGHLSAKATQLLAKGDIARGLTLKPSSIKSGNFECVPCYQGKMRRHAAPKERSTEISSEVLELVFADLNGPISPETVGDKRYALGLLDDHSRYQWQFLLRNKSDAAQAFKTWLAQVERETGKKLKKLRTDGGKEFTAGQFLHELEREGVILETTAPYDHHQAGAIERTHLTIFNRTRAILKANNLPKHLWGEISTAVSYLKNLSPTSALNGRTPYEAYKGRLPDLRRLRALGCKVMVHRPSEVRDGKLDDRAVEGKFAGYYQNSKAYRVWDPKKRKIIKSNDLEFF